MPPVTVHVLSVLLACMGAAAWDNNMLQADETQTSPHQDLELKELVHRLDTDDVTAEHEPGFLRQVRKYSRRLWHINCSARRRRFCHCYSRQLRQYFCCNCDMGPCFPGNALVYTPDGNNVAMTNLSIGHIVLAGDAEGHIVPSKVLGFLDKRPSEQAVYTTLETLSGRQVTLSGNHLIFAGAENTSLEPTATSFVRPGHQLLTKHANLSLNLNRDTVVSVKHALLTGAYVPLTEHGTLIVDGALASCYASFPHELAHWALAPARLAPSLLLDSEYSQHQAGLRSFPRLLKALGRVFLPQQADPDPSNKVLKFDLSLSD